MEPGGSHGLQNRSRPDDVGLGGFDSHALPPTHLQRVGGISRMLKVRFALLIAVVFGAVRGSASAAQVVRTDTAQRIAVDSLKPPISPRRAFFYSFLMPGYSQSVLGRHKAATTFLLIEAIGVAMVRESAADAHEARRMATDSIVVSWVDASGNLTRVITPPPFSSKEVRTRDAHVEDWVAVVVANHLIAGADA